MARNFRKLFNGLQLVGQNSITPTLAGEIRYNSDTGRFQIFDSTTRNLTTDDGSAAFTNKTFDAEGTGNSLTNIKDSNIKANAGIAYSKLSLSNSIVNADVNNAAAIAYSKLNLSDSIINSDINSAAAIAYSKLSLSNSIVNADVNNAAAIAYSKLNLANSIVDTDIDSEASDLGQVLTSDGNGNATWADQATTPDQGNSLINLAIAASISSNELTIALKNKAGNNPDSNDAVKIAFRNSTATTGTYVLRSVDSALSLTLGTAVSLGQATATSFKVWIYALDNGGAVELFASAHRFWAENRLQSTSTTGTSNAVLYGDNARASKAIRLIGAVKATWTSGTGWSSITNVDLGPFQGQELLAISYEGGSGTGVTTIPYNTKVLDTHNCWSTSTNTFTAPVTGFYQLSIGIDTTSNAALYDIVPSSGQSYNLCTSGTNTIRTGIAGMYLTAGLTFQIIANLSVTIGNNAEFHFLKVALVAPLEI